MPSDGLKSRYLAAVMCVVQEKTNIAEHIDNKNTEAEDGDSNEESRSPVIGISCPGKRYSEPNTPNGRFC